MSTVPEQLFSTGFFRCLLCGESVEVNIESENPSVRCSCGLFFDPGVSSREELLSLWNKGLIRDVVFTHAPKTKFAFLQSGHFYYWLAVSFFCIYRLLEVGLSGLLFCAGFFSLFYSIFLFFLSDKGKVVGGNIMEEVDDFFTPRSS
jgi:hypothetical protein